jgi:hypothetical protein
MRVLIPALVLVAAILQASPPDRSKQQKPSNEKQNLAKTPPPSPSVAAVNNQDCPCKEVRSTNTQPQETPEKSMWGDIPTWLLVVVGGVAAWIALRTLRDIKIQTQNAGIAARAAETSANAIIRSERPWLLISHVRVEQIVWNSQRVQGAYFVIQNYGKSPAWVVNMGGTFETLNNLGELPSEPVYKHSANEEKRGIVIVPSSGGDDRTESHIFKFPHNSLTTDAGFQEVVNQKQNVWCIYGFVSYRDVFDMGNIHETRFCHKLDDWPRFRAVDAGPNYNRQT